MAPTPDEATEQSKRTDEVAVLIKAMSVLSYLAAETSSSVARICEATGVSKPSAYRILKTLEQGGYVVRDEGRREYSIGPALFGLARSLRNSNDLVQLARPVLETLNDELGETVNLGVVNNNQVVYLDTIESAQRLRATVHIAIRDHIHSTALGKAILSVLPREEARAMLTSTDRPALTPNTTTNVKDLMVQLEQYAIQGFALDDEENEVGSRCVGAPILDSQGQPVAAISVSAPTSRMNAKTIASVGRRLTAVCADLGRSLG